MSFEKPNIIWICTDQQRFDTIHALGNPYIHTPNLDQLAANGVVFTNAFCQSPICTPSRASFLTSRYPRTTRCRQNGQKIPADEVLITKILAENGYDCALAGKLHIAPCDGRMEERIDDGYGEFHWSHGPFPKWPENEYIQWLQEKGKSWSDVYPYSPAVSAQLGPKGLAPNGSIVWSGVPAEYHQTTWCIDKAIEYFSKPHQGPWMISVNPFDPHHPFDPPREFLEKYDPAALPSPVYQEGELRDKPCFQEKDHESAYGGTGISYKHTSDLQHRQIKAAYYGMIELIDYNIGRLLAVLKVSGQLDNTIIIFMSDHGEMMGDHGIFLKGPYVYEPVIHVPLIISWPKFFKKGLKSTALVELIDVAPTILEAAELPIPSRMQGKSLAGICKGLVAADYHRDFVFTEYYNTLAFHRDPTPYLTMIRDHQYKIVVYHGIADGELYDLENDPQEFDNLWNHPDYEKIKNQYLKKSFDASVFTMDPAPDREGIF
jgi:arylsulfatase